MDDYQGEDCIAVGSTGTLLSLMGKEMEILQARRSCSVSYNNMNYKKSPSAKDPNTLYASNVFGFPASPLMNPPSTSIVSSLWSDLKGLLRSPTSIYHSPLIYHNNAHSPLIYHSNALFYKELEINEDSRAFCNKSPLSTHPHTISPKRTYPKKRVAINSQAPAQITSPSSSKEIYPTEGSAAVLDSCPASQKPSMQTYPKERVATEAISYSNQTSSLNDGCLKEKADYPHAFYKYPKERLSAGATNYPNLKSPLHYPSQERSAISYANQKDTVDVYQATPTGIHDQETLKGNVRSKEQSLAVAAAANPPKGKAMDAANPNLQYPTYLKAKSMDVVYAMRRTTISNADSRNGKILEEARGGARSSRRSNRKREERAISSNMQQDEYCMQKREERGRLQNEYAKRSEERERMQDEYWCMQRREEGGLCMQEYEKKPMLQDMEKGACITPASASPVNMRPCFKASRSFEGRSLPPVSVVDLQCCHTPTSRERSSSRRLSFTRLSSF